MPNVLAPQGRNTRSNATFTEAYRTSEANELDYEALPHDPIAEAQSQVEIRENNSEIPASREVRDHQLAIGIKEDADFLNICRVNALAEGKLPTSSSNRANTHEYGLAG